jgi:peptidoglycan hydrolase-like protein with peptidoglycan-binding domain
MKRPLILIAVLALLGSSVNDFPTSQITPPAARPVTVPLAAPMLLVTDEVPARRDPPIVLPKPSPVIDDKRLRVGSRGPAVEELETRLSGLGYMVGKVDGIFDAATRHGLIAFQKVEGLSRSGEGDDAALKALPTAARPSPAYSTPPDHLEVDVARQVVLVVRGGAATAILPTSTGSNRNFTNGGWTRRAITPNGQFKVTRKINAMRISPLGELYKPSYFNGGIAFHGNGSVPTYPASHGCVRLPMAFADWFFQNAAPIGMVVYVYGGPSGPNPQPFIDDQAAPATALPPSDVPPASPAATEPPSSGASPEDSPPAPPPPSPIPSPVPSPDAGPTGGAGQPGGSL